MAMADYLRCAIPECDCKVYYDGDIDWPSRAQFVKECGEPSYPEVLCGEHNKTHWLAVTPRAQEDAQ